MWRCSSLPPCALTGKWLTLESELSAGIHQLPGLPTEVTDSGLLCLRLVWILTNQRWRKVIPKAAQSPGRGRGACSLAWRTRALKSSLQWPELPWEQWDLALGPLVSRADASSIPRKLGQFRAPLCQAGRRAGALLGGSDFLHLPVPMP